MLSPVLGDAGADDGEATAIRQWNPGDTRYSPVK
jgi:hypothetical protein